MASEPLGGRERGPSARESRYETPEPDGMAPAFGAILGVGLGVCLWLLVIAIAALALALA